MLPLQEKVLTVYLVVTERAEREELDVRITRHFSGVTLLWHGIGETRNCTTAEALAAEPLICFFGDKAKVILVNCHVQTPSRLLVGGSRVRGLGSTFVLKRAEEGI